MEDLKKELDAAKVAHKRLLEENVALRNQVRELIQMVGVGHEEDYDR